MAIHRDNAKPNPNPRGIAKSEDYAAWLAATLDGLHLDRIFLAGMSYGGWLALNFAAAAPERVSEARAAVPWRRLRDDGETVQPAQDADGVVPDTPLVVNWFMRWLGATGPARPVPELTYLGLKHFRVPVETLRVMPVLFPDDRLRAMRVPTLLFVGDHEVICDPA